MCGRTAETDIANMRRAILRLFPNVPDFLLMDHPRYNVPPSLPLTVVGETKDGRFAERMKWGLVPSWAKDQKIGNKLANARIETAAEKPSFSSAMKQRRCLIFVSGFFEWRAEKPVKQPFYIYRADGEPMVFAGLWESWRQPNGTPLHTCTILTREPNGFMANVHNRMPVILEQPNFEPWIDPRATTAPVLPPTEEDVLMMYPVSRVVNSPKNDGPECVEPIEA
jgi:putative SOS response-associated peptidase YedK